MDEHRQVVEDLLLVDVVDRSRLVDGMPPQLVRRAAGGYCDG